MPNEIQKTEPNLLDGFDYDEQYEDQEVLRVVQY